MLNLNDPEKIASSFQTLLTQAPVAEFTQLSLAVEPVDLLSWLHGQQEVLQFFWTSRKRAFMVATSGAIQTWETLAAVEQDLASLPEDSPLRCYGGWRFMASGLAFPWQDWPQSAFFLPRWELRCEDQIFRLCLNLKGSRPDWKAQLEAAMHLLRPPVELGMGLPDLGPLHHQPIPAHWNDQILRAQQLFAAGDLRKLVLSRVSQASLETLPLTLMQRLLEQGREAYHVWYRPVAGQILWGASPERLYARKGRTLWTEALAGTRPRPADPGQQEVFRQELLASHKEFEENEWVRQHLETALLPITTQLEADPLRVIPSGPVQHLYRCVQAELASDISDTQLVRVLHPTPAVSGFPSKQAVTCLTQIESHDRGWYTGALGWISPQAAEWSVILRCALWQPGQIHFYTGAGIMPASEPAAEWLELDLKLSSLLALWG